MVYTIRKFRPDVIVSRWNGTVTDGHGHHQFTGYLTLLQLKPPPMLVVPGTACRRTDPLAGSEALRERKKCSHHRDSPCLVNTGEYDPYPDRAISRSACREEASKKPSRWALWNYRDHSILCYGWSAESKVTGKLRLRRHQYLCQRNREVRATLSRFIETLGNFRICLPQF